MQPTVPLVLIVDDDAQNRDVLAQMLIFSGYGVRQAASGDQALRAAEQHRPDIILMDLAMPELDGWATTRMLKRHPRLASIPVIAVTAHVLAEARQLARSVGCSHFIAKPVMLDALLPALEQALTAA